MQLHQPLVVRRKTIPNEFQRWPKYATTQTSCCVKQDFLKRARMYPEIDLLTDQPNQFEHTLDGQGFPIRSSTNLVEKKVGTWKEFAIVVAC